MFESELRGWRPQTTDPRRTTGASVRATGITGEPVPRRGCCYKRVTALRMRAWRWHGGPFHTHTTYEYTGSSVGNKHCCEHDYWQQIRTWTGQLGLGEASWRERAQRTQLWHSGVQSRSVERYSAGRVGPPKLCLVSRVVGSSPARDSCTSRQLMPHHHSARAGRAARRHVNPAAQTARPARHGTSTCVQVAAVPRRRLVGASVAAGGAGRARHSPGGPDA